MSPRELVDGLSVLGIIAITLRLTMFLVWLWSYRGGSARTFMLCIVGAAAGWGWFCAARAIADPTYLNDTWNTANLVVIVVAWAVMEFGFRRLTRR